MGKKVLPFSRRRINELFINYLRLNAGMLVRLALGLVALLAVFTWLESLLLEDTSTRFYVLGAFHAAMVGVALHLIYMTFLAQEVEAIRHLRGAWGEENTRDVLRSAKRRRVIWGWVDSIDTQGGDIDHLVLTRRGGVVALDSKWRSDADAFNPTDILPSARKTRLRADAIMRTILRSERGSHRARVDAVTTRAAVIVWGRAQREVDGVRVLDDVHFVAGSDFVSWLRKLDGEHVSRKAAAEILSGLENFRAGTRRPNGN